MIPDNLTLSPCQSLALRRAVDAMKADDRIFDACPAVVRSALCDFLMPPYSDAEAEIKALQEDRESTLRLLETFGRKIRDLEARSVRRIPPCPVPLP